MSDPMKQAWNDVAEDFSRLGKVMKERYQGHAAEAEPEDVAGADAGVKAAFERLLAAGREFGDRIADVVAGDDVRNQAKQTGQKLSDAMTATADLLGEQVRGVVKGTRRHADPAEDAASDARDAPATVVDATVVDAAVVDVTGRDASGDARAADDGPII